MNMMDNSSNQLNDVFFYGLYMDPELLRAKGVEPRNPRVGMARGYRLRVGKLATLVRAYGSVAHGVIYSLTHAEVHKLYWGSGLDAYVPEHLSVVTADYETIIALCCNLLVPPSDDESNPEYLEKLTHCMRELGLPEPHII